MGHRRGRCATPSDAASLPSLLRRDLQQRRHRRDCRHGRPFRRRGSAPCHAQQVHLGFRRWSRRASYRGSTRCHTMGREVHRARVGVKGRGQGSGSWVGFVGRVRGHPLCWDPGSCPHTSCHVSRVTRSPRVMDLPAGMETSSTQRVSLFGVHAPPYAAVAPSSASVSSTRSTRQHSTSSVRVRRRRRPRPRPRLRLRLRLRLRFRLRFRLRLRRRLRRRLRFRGASRLFRCRRAHSLIPPPWIRGGARVRVRVRVGRIHRPIPPPSVARVQFRVIALARSHPQG